MSQKENQNKGGRPRKVDFPELRKIAEDYFLYVAEGDVSFLNKKGRFTNLAQYAHTQNLDYTPTDFSRCKPLTQYLDELCRKYNSDEEFEMSGIPGYVPLDIDYFSRPDVTAKERNAAMLDRDKYYQRLHISSAKALEVYADQCSNIEKLRSQLAIAIKERDDEAYVAQSLRQENRALEKANRYFKQYIRNYVEPAIANAVLTGSYSDTITTKASVVMPTQTKEPAVISLAQLLSSDIDPFQDADDIECLLSRIEKDVAEYEKD